jgi:hypothetical protein
MKKTKQVTKYRITVADKKYKRDPNLKKFTEFGSITLGEARELKRLMRKYFNVEIIVEKRQKKIAQLVEESEC